jgi:hypothetical protein
LNKNTTLIDLTGKTFNFLEVLKRVENRAGKPWWLVKCICGVEKEVSGSHLRTGNIKSCGCMRKELTTTWLRENKSFEDITGVRFGSLTAVEYFRNNNGDIRWKCVCDCGGVTNVYIGHLKCGNTVSCGCAVKGPKKPNLVGQVFGRLVVKKELRGYYGKGGGSAWVVECACGTEKIMTTGSLLSGNNVSCGCYKSELGTERLNNYIKEHTKELHPQWNPNLTDEDRIDRRTLEPVIEWAKDVKARDKYTCKICGIHNNLHSHHLDSYRAHPERRVDPSNGVTLCKECHKKFHSTYGRKVTYEWQFVEYYYKNQNQKFLKLDIAN